MRRHCQFTVKQSPKCAVRDGVELLVLAAGDPVAKEAANNRAKDAKYRHGHKYPQDRIRAGIADVVPIDEEDQVMHVGGVVYAQVEADERGGKPNTCAENTAYDNTSNYHTAFHNPMRRQCQFTVKRFRVDHVTRFAVRCRSAAGDNPVGSRFERGTPMPEVKDSYDNEAEAQVAATKLQTYIDEYESKRKPSRRRKRR